MGARLPHACWFPALLAVLLLFAQHGALTHLLTHAPGPTDSYAHAAAGSLTHGADTHGHETGSPEDTPSRNLSGSCAFDLVYSQVLGGVHGGHDLTFAVSEQVLVVTAAIAVRSSVTVVPYDSRGPPVIS